MGFEPTTYCRHCDEPLDVYQPAEDRFCDEECKAAFEAEKAHAANSLSRLIFGATQ
jgi:predicted nucleic acid-binding Zn ribbon protein